MHPEDPEAVPREGGPGAFTTTHWSVVLEAGNTKSSRAAVALDHLCRMYWYPLYAFCRRQNRSAEDAQDLTQAFFSRLIEKKTLRLADPARGRFRTFLLSSFKNFLINDWAKETAARRGGQAAFVPWDVEEPEHLYATEAPGPDAESLFDKRWATTVLQRVLNRLQAECRAAGREPAFEALKSFIWGEEATRSYSELGRALQTSEGAVGVMVHRLRTRFRELLREEISKTVAEPAQIEDELRYLAKVMSR